MTYCSRLLHFSHRTAPSINMKDKQNFAAYLVSPKSPKLQVSPSPYTSPQADQVVMRNRAIALNPVDHMIQSNGTTLMFPWLQYPAIFGVDVAGEVVEVGSNVSKFQIGDRVIGQTLGSDKGRGDSQNPEAGFQLFTVLRQHMTCEIPNKMSFQDACVIPLGCSTAACGLFQKDQLGLDLPSPQRQRQNKTVLIWGGSTSVGSNAIQLAKAAGYNIITTCSPSNFDFCHNLGADKCFDYKSPTVTTDIISSFKNTNTICAGALSIGPNSANACIDILTQLPPSICPSKFVSVATYPSPNPQPTSLVLPRTIFTFLAWNIKTWIRCKYRGIGWKFIFGSTLAENEVGPTIYGDFLPGALKRGEYFARPEPHVIGHGLEKIQEGLNVLRKGVSARKIVVTLGET